MKEEALREYIDEVYNQTDILLSKQERIDFEKELEDLLINKIGDESIKMLDKESKEEYYKFLEKNPNEEEISFFFETKIKDFNKKIDQIILDFFSEVITKIKTTIVLSSVDTEKYKNTEIEENTEESIENILLEKNKEN